MKSMECGLGFQDLVHNFGHFITSVLHNFGSALYLYILSHSNVWRQKSKDLKNNNR